MFGRIVTIIGKYVDLQGINITPKSSFHDDLGADSLDTMNIIADIETEFDVEIPDRISIHLSTISDVIEYINSVL